MRITDAIPDLFTTMLEEETESDVGVSARCSCFTLLTVLNFHRGLWSQSGEALGMASLAGQALMEAMGAVYPE